MLMEKMGYILSEAPVLFFVIWFTVRLIQFRRWRRKQPIFSEIDRSLLFGNPKRRSETITFYLKLSLAIVVAAAVTVIEFITLAPLGAAIITGALLLTSGMILRQLLPLDE
ncbi:MAG TPA: hypothetical protein VMS25_10675 [Candidatus Limnocylindrales bacterium]|jgi:hypothetical protein|nr:hypothetical protein [Candidatus Limnocylindrales bacterium]